jgi:HAD superfamily hydrolase (TIGR01509 family)
LALSKLPLEVMTDFWRTLYYCPTFNGTKEPNLHAKTILRVPTPNGEDPQQFNKRFVDFCNIQDSESVVHFARAIVNEFGGTITDDALRSLKSLRNHVASNMRPYPGALEAVEFLRKNVGEVWIASNDAGFYRAELKKRLGKHLRIAICSSDVQAVKPTREYFERAAAKRGVRFDQLLFIDDNLENVLAATSLGIMSILIVDPNSTVEIPPGVRTASSVDAVALAFQQALELRLLKRRRKKVF